MKIFIAGATGVLGRRVVTGLRSHGHEVLGLARSPENERTIRSLGGEPRRANLFDAGSLAEAAGGAEVVIRAATAIPRTVRLHDRDWAMNDRIRVEGTRALLNATKRIGARLYVQEGIVWVAQPADGGPFNETSPVVPKLWYGSAAESERLAREASERDGFAAATLRFGSFYGADSFQTRLMGERIARLKLPILGPGDAVWSNIHLDDAAGAMVAAAEAGKSGLWHVVDDRPATISEYFTTLADLLGAPPPKHVSLGLARLALGRGAVAFLTTSTRTSNTRIRAQLGWSPTYPTIDEGLRDVVSSWKAEGFPLGAARS